MSQNKVTTTCSMQQESAPKLTTSLNPKADPDAVAAKKTD